MPGPLGIFVPWVLSAMVCVLLAGRKLSVIRLGISVAVSQFLFHMLFVLGTITPSGPVGPHVHGAVMQLPAGSALPEAVAADASMWLGHAVAALVTIIVLHRAERMLLALRDLAVDVIVWLRSRLGVVAFTQLPSSARSHLVGAEDETLPDAPHLRAVRQRGPPPSLAV